MVSLTAQESKISLRGFGHLTQLGQMDPMGTFGPGIQVDWNYFNRAHASISLSTTQSSYTTRGGSRRVENGVVVYDNSFEYTIAQRATPIDLRFMLDLTGSQIHNFLVGIGSSFVLYSFEHPDEVVINDGIIQPYNFTKTTSSAFLLTLSLQYDWNISSSWVAFTSANFRIPLSQKNLLDEPYMGGTIPVEWLPSLGLGLGYRF